MIQKLKQWIRILLGRFRLWIHPPQAPSVAVPQPVQAGTWHRMHRPNQRTNPVLHAFNEIFAPRHAAEEQVLFRSVGSNGIAVEKSEEWFRERNSLKTVSKRSLVITCSGEIVRPDSIKSQCAACGGFDSQIVRCAHPLCGIPLCRLHQKIFTQPSGPVTYCQKHFSEAIKNFDTWAALDRTKNQSRKL